MSSSKILLFFVFYDGYYSLLNFLRIYKANLFAIMNKTVILRLLNCHNFQSNDFIFSVIVNHKNNIKYRLINSIIPQISLLWSLSYLRFLCIALECLLSFLIDHDSDLTSFHTIDNIYQL